MPVETETVAAAQDLAPVETTPKHHNIEQTLEMTDLTRALWDRVYYPT